MDTETKVTPVETKTVQAPASNYRYAGFWIRVVAALIDAIIISIVGFIIQQIIGESDPVAIIIGAAYHIGLWIKMDGMTFGKKVIQTNGQPLDIKTAVLRYIGYMISGLVLAIGFIWVAFDKNKQGWHDKIAGTYVVYK